MAGSPMCSSPGSEVRVKPDILMRGMTVAESVWWSLRSYVVVKVKGPRPERFLNAATKAGIALHNVERLSQDLMVVTVNADLFGPLRTLTRATAWKISIVRRLGLSFTLRKLVRRRGLAIGGLLSFAALYVLSTFIWFVDVEGSVEVPVEQIMAVARASGLHPGVSKHDLSTRDVERSLLLTVDRLAWANVDIRGTLATIRVAEKAVPDTAITVPGDVMAAHDGVIEEIITMRGVPMVAVGDTVTAGQLLISGLIPVQDPAHSAKLAKGEPPYVHADGIVKAQVWYEGNAESALVIREDVLTGRVHRRLYWKWGKYSGSLGAPAPYDAYKEKLISWQPGLGRFRLPGSITWERRAEVKVVAQTVDPDEARENALAAAWEQVQAALPAGAIISQPPQIMVESTDDGGTEIVRARIVVNVQQDIGRFQPVSSSEPQPKAVGGSLPATAQPVPGP